MCIRIRVGRAVQRRARKVASSTRRTSADVISGITLFIDGTGGVGQAVSPLFPKVVGPRYRSRRPKLVLASRSGGSREDHVDLPLHQSHRDVRYIGRWFDRLSASNEPELSPLPDAADLSSPSSQVRNTAWRFLRILRSYFPENKRLIGSNL